MNTQEQWTPEAVTFLVENAAFHTKEELSESLNIDPVSIRDTCRALGLTLKSSPRAKRRPHTRRQITTTEWKIVDENIDKPVAELYKLLPQRCPNTVRYMVRQLLLSRPTEKLDEADRQKPEQGVLFEDEADSNADSSYYVSMTDFEKTEEEDNADRADTKYSDAELEKFKKWAEYGAECWRRDHEALYGDPRSVIDIPEDLASFFAVLDDKSRMQHITRFLNMEAQLNNIADIYSGKNEEKALKYRAWSAEIHHLIVLCLSGAEGTAQALVRWRELDNLLNNIRE